MKTKAAILVSSFAVLLFVVVGSMGGVHASSNDGAYRQLQVYSEVLSRVRSEYVEEPNIPKVTDGALHGLLESLDSNSSYMTADAYKQYKAHKKESKGEIGATVSKRFGVIMDVVNAEHAAIAEEAGAVAVMALERVPADIRAAGGVARMADPVKIQEIMDAVTIPVMAKCRIGHVAEARALEALGVDMIDESEVLTPADPFFHVNKREFSVPFVCGCRNLGEAVRRIYEGAAMMRTKGEAGTGDVVEATRHVWMVNEAIAELKERDKEQLYAIATKFSENYARLLKEVRTIAGEELEVKEADIVFAGKNLDEVTEGLFQILTEIKKIRRLPVVNFAAGGVATPADAALMMMMGCDGVFVGSGIFKSEDPEKRGRAIVDAVAHFDDPNVVAEVSKGLGLPMKGTDAKALPVEARLQDRGW